MFKGNIPLTEMRGIELAKFRIVQGED